MAPHRVVARCGARGGGTLQDSPAGSWAVSPPRPAAAPPLTPPSRPRVEWAQARQTFFSSGRNKAALDAIERAAFFVALDEECHCQDPSDDACLSLYGKALLHGNCCNRCAPRGRRGPASPRPRHAPPRHRPLLLRRWFDKSFTLVVFKNGKMGLNTEHAWADAPIIGHLWEARGQRGGLRGRLAGAWGLGTGTACQPDPLPAVRPGH